MSDLVREIDVDTCRLELGDDFGDIALTHEGLDDEAESFETVHERDDDVVEVVGRAASQELTNEIVDVADAAEEETDTFSEEDARWIITWAEAMMRVRVSVLTGSAGRCLVPTRIEIRLGPRICPARWRSSRSLGSYRWPASSPGS
jgi:hypothetical protein